MLCFLNKKIRNDNGVLLLIVVSLLDFAIHIYDVILHYGFFRAILPIWSGKGCFSF